MATALVLMAHGSRNADANADLVALAEKIRALGRYHAVAASYLELAEPDIAAACRQCVRNGATHVIMLPYFLSAGVHVLRDLANLRDALRVEFPGVRFNLAEPLGRHPLMIEVVLDRADAAQAGGGA